MTTTPTQPQRSRLTEPSSAAGFAALLALLVPSVADQAAAEASGRAYGSAGCAPDDRSGRSSSVPMGRKIVPKRTYCQWVSPLATTGLLLSCREWTHAPQLGRVVLRHQEMGGMRWPSLDVFLHQP